MLTKDMNLMQMLQFKPTDEDMASLDLNIIVYIKALFISNSFENNKEMMKHIIENNNTDNLFTNLSNTSFYEYKSKNNKCLTITELYSTVKYSELECYLKEILDEYKTESLYSINMYTHDNHHYVLDNIEGYNNLEKII